MHSRAPTTRFFVALTDYLRDQSRHRIGATFTVGELDTNSSNPYQKTFLVNTGETKLTEEQRTHIKALAENLIPPMYSAKFEFKP